MNGNPVEYLCPRMTQSMQFSWKEPKNLAGTKRYKGFMLYTSHHGDIDDIDNEEK